MEGPLSYGLLCCALLPKELSQDFILSKKGERTGVFYITYSFSYLLKFHFFRLKFTFDFE